MKISKLGALCALAISTALSPAMAEEGITDTEIVIGNILPMTSSAALVGRAAHFGSVVAAAEANADGGVNGRQVVIRTEDDGYVPARTVQGLRKHIDEGVFGLIGTGAGAGTAAILPILEEEGIPAIVSFSPLQAAVDPIKPTVFMIGASYQDLLFAQLKYIHENHNPDNAKYGVIRQDDDFGKQVEEAFTRAVDAFEVDAADPIRYKRGQKDFGAEILKVRSNGVNVLIAGGVTTEIPTMLKESSKFKLPLQVATVPTSTLPPIMKLSAPYGYSYYSGDYISPMGSEGTAHFMEVAKASLSEDELKALNRYAVTGYVATRMMIEAIRRCGDNPTRACAVEKLESGEEFDTAGVTLPLTFAKDRHISATAVRVLEVDPVAGSVTPVTDFAQY
ncbi:ABC transporter substrate-binding protein [Nitratireductor sp. XY-223]|uniref:ABC transporter substrate-binding protein n=1 Tax=Nitratireductor sp. XY-223 TaxID=2561926 RepID=UPI0010AAE17F|nr:ABC transporter substrate-binding protein [Nitratireductor sp. XY-223]